MQLNFKMSELLHSDKASEYKINNIPDDTAIFNNLLDLIVNCLQPIRDKLKKPMIITSGFRCKEVNTLVKGKLNSQHLKGQAVDFKVKGMTTKEIIEFILKTGIEFDQLIDERTWVHISYVKGKNRKQVLKG